MGKQNMAVTFRKVLAISFIFYAANMAVGMDAHAQGYMPPSQEQADDPAYAAQQEREQFVKEIRRVEGLNRKYTQQIDEIKDLLAEKDEDFQRRMVELENRLSQPQEENAKAKIVQEKTREMAKELESKTNEMLAKGGNLDPEDQLFKEELTKAHYNMGNIYFERGEYQRSVVEYYQAADLTPNDADTHYNLAFISGEYLGDQETALKHYQWYLYLKPNADDMALVNEKILQAKLYMRAKIDSTLDKNNGHFNLTR